MANKMYNSLIKMTALALALSSASCCCCWNHKRSVASRVVPQKSEVVKTAPCPQPKQRAKKVITPYQTGEILHFPIQSIHPLPGNYVAPINIDGTSFPIQNKNPLPGNVIFLYGRCYY